MTRIQTFRNRFSGCIVNGYVRIGCNFMALDETVSLWQLIRHARTTYAIYLWDPLIPRPLQSRQYIMDDVTKNIR